MPGLTPPRYSACIQASQEGTGTHSSDEKHGNCDRNPTRGGNACTLSRIQTEVQRTTKSMEDFLIFFPDPLPPVRAESRDFERRSKRTRTSQEEQEEVRKVRRKTGTVGFDSDALSGADRICLSPFLPEAFPFFIQGSISISLLHGFSLSLSYFLSRDLPVVVGAPAQLCI